MNLIPKEEIDRMSRKRAAFSQEIDKVVELCMQIRKEVPGCESFNASAIDIGSMPTGELKEQIILELNVCQIMAFDIDVNFARWQQFELPQILIEKEEEEDEEPEA